MSDSPVFSLCFLGSCLWCGGIQRPQLYSKIQFLSCRVGKVSFLNLQAGSHGRVVLPNTKLSTLALTSGHKSSAQTGKGKLTFFLFAFCVPVLPLLSWLNIGASFSLWPSDHLAVIFLKYFFSLVHVSAKSCYTLCVFKVI